MDQEKINKIENMYNKLEKQLEILRSQKRIVIRNIIIKVVICFVLYYAINIIGNHLTFIEATVWFFTPGQDIADIFARLSIVFGSYLAASIIFESFLNPIPFRAYLRNNFEAYYAVSPIRKMLAWCAMVIIPFVTLVPLAYGLISPSAQGVVFVVLSVFWMLFFVVWDIVRIVKCQKLINKYSQDITKLEEHLKENNLEIKNKTIHDDVDELINS